VCPEENKEEIEENKDGALVNHEPDEPRKKRRYGRIKSAASKVRSDYKVTPKSINILDTFYILKQGVHREDEEHPIINPSSTDENSPGN
jgi:hypothetical protein